MDRRLVCILAAGLLAVGCTEDDTTPNPSRDGGPGGQTDSGPSGGGNTDAGSGGNNDAGTADGGTNASDAGPVVFTCNASGTPFGGGDGTMASPYTICSAAQFDRVRETANASKYYVLTESIDLADLGSAYQPIPTFSGQIDGNGYVIYGLSGTGLSSFALIDQLEGTVKNLFLLDVSLEGTRAISTFALTLVADTNARLEKVVATGSIDISERNASGIVGAVQNGAVVDQALFVGTLSSTYTTDFAFMGGIAWSIAVGATARRVSAMGQITSTRQKFGGLVSDLGGTLENCVSGMRLSGPGQAGGIAAVLSRDAIIRDCVSRGDIDASAANTGGIYASTFTPSGTTLNITLERVLFVGDFADVAGDPVGPNVAAAASTYTHVFWDNTRVPGSSGVTGPTGLSTSDLRNPSTASLNPLAGPTWVREQDEYPRLVFEEMLLPAEIPCRASATPYGGGRGTVFLPYIVCTPTQLNEIRNDPDQSFLIARDIDLTGVTFEPIPTFSGFLNGNDKAIRNWTAGGASATEVAFIQELDGGYIQDLRLEDVTLTAAGQLAGLVLGTVANSDAYMRNVQVTGSLTTSAGNVGGVVRLLSANTFLEGALFDGTITSTGGSFHGGVVQNIRADAAARRVMSRGTMILSGNAEKAGGIVSDLSGVLEECKSGISVTSARNQRVGGIAAVLAAGTGGADGARVRDCYATNVFNLVAGVTPTIVGGLFGEVFQTGDAPVVDRTFFAGSYLGTNGNAVIGDNTPAPVFNDVFWDSTTTAITAAGPTGTAPKTTTELQTTATFTSYSSPPWMLMAGAYPKLTFEAAF